MKRALRHLVPPLLAVLALGACSELALFGPSAADERRIELPSLKEGDFLHPGDRIAFLVTGSGPQGEVLTLDIDLQNAAGVTVWSTSLDSPALNEELQIVLPELETGRYQIDLRLDSSSGSQEERHLSFFYVQGEYAVEGISSFPPTILPGAQITLSAELRYPQGADPYVRWSQDNRVFAGGVVSKGLNRVSWPAPQEEGVYSIRVELFPVAPLRGEFSFASPASLSARLYISAAPAARGDGLGPPASYLSLFHFDGTLRDTGFAAASGGPQAAEPLQNPSFVTQQSYSGYRLGPRAGAVYDRFVLPVKDGALQPFTITVDLVPDSPASPGEILLVTESAGTFRLLLSVDGQGRPQASIETGGATTTLPSGIESLQPGKAQRLDLSVIPNQGSLAAMWFLNGVQTASLARAVHLSGLTGQGSTRLGGEAGYGAIVSELGVYSRDERDRPAVDPGVFRAAMERRYGRALVLADGFDGMYVDADLQLSGQGATEKGNLRLAAGASVTLPLFEEGERATVAEIRPAGAFSAGSRIELTWEYGSAPFARIDPRGSLAVAGQGPASFSAGAEPLILVLGSGSLTVESLEGRLTRPLPAPERESRWVSLRVSAPQEAPLLLDSLLVRWQD